MRRGYIRRRGNSYSITVSAGFDPVTKRRVQVHGSAPSQEEAEVELTRILRDIDTGTLLDPERIGTGAYLLDRWLPHIRTRVRPRTATRYRQLLERHIVPKVGGIPLRKLRPLHVQAALDAMTEADLAPRTVASAYRVLHAALAQAIRWQLLATNVALAASPPRAERPDIVVPSASTVRSLLAAVEGTRHWLPLHLAAYTGMRRGEILALRWEQVDLGAGLARVVASLQHVDGEIRWVEPKTPRSRRTVALPGVTVTALRAQRKDQARRRLLLGEYWADLDMVSDQGDGRPLSPDGLSRAFYRLARAIGSPDVRLHDLRHAYATRLLEAGVNPKVVSEALGHSSVGFTLDTYSHVLPSMQQAAADAIEAALGVTEA